jgi:glucose-1-phosphate thymidylyltransferase
MLGIILAGGHGTRLYPSTIATSKQLLPIYDKPTIFYPLSTVMLAGIKKVLIITASDQLGDYKKLLGDGSELGMDIKYATQDYPKGLADAFLIADSLGYKDDDVFLVLGDNVMYGHDFPRLVEEGWTEASFFGSCIYGYRVPDPSQFGIIQSHDGNKVRSVVEKPQQPCNNLAIPGMYFFNRTVYKKAKKVKPSHRGELEITSVIEQYIEEGKCRFIEMGRGISWFDVGSIEGMYDATNFIRSVQKSQGLMVANLEEIAMDRGWITGEALRRRVDKLYKKGVAYGDYLRDRYKEFWECDGVGYSIK